MGKYYSFLTPSHLRVVVLLEIDEDEFALAANIEGGVRRPLKKLYPAVMTPQRVTSEELLVICESTKEMALKENLPAAESLQAPKKTFMQLKLC